MGAPRYVRFSCFASLGGSAQPYLAFRLANITAGGLGAASPIFVGVFWSRWAKGVLRASS